MERAKVLRENYAIFIAKSNISTSLGHSQTVTQRRQNIKTLCGSDTQIIFFITINI